MVRVIKYDEKYDKAVRHIFGKTLICRELEAAVKTAKSHRFDCVTLDGDKVASRGVLTGILLTFLFIEHVKIYDCKKAATTTPLAPHWRSRSVVPYCKRRKKSWRGT